jgi:hypothetical protein
VDGGEGKATACPGRIVQHSVEGVTGEVADPFDTVESFVDAHVPLRVPQGMDLQVVTNHDHVGRFVEHGCLLARRLRLGRGGRRHEVGAWMVLRRGCGPVAKRLPVKRGSGVCDHEGWAASQRARSLSTSPRVH